MSAISGRLLSDCEAEQERAPLGYLRSGRAVWPVTGAEPDDDDDQDDDDDDTSGDDDGGKAKSKSKDDSKDDDDEDDEPISREEYERLKKRMRKADQRATTAEQALREKEREGKPVDETMKADLESAQGEVKTLRETVSSLRLENAFLLSNTVQWHDPEVAMSLVLKDDGVEIDDEGNVAGLDGALKRLAKKKPYLVKQTKSTDDEDEDDDDDEDDEPPAARRQRSGGRGGGNPRQRKGADRAKIIATYPALNRR